VEVRVFVLRIGVRFVDTWKPQLQAIRAFLVGKGISLGAVGRGGGSKRPAHRLDVGEQASVLKAIRSMIPFCVKKREDLQIALDYLEERITGDEAIARFRGQYSIGRRRGEVRLGAIPFTRQRGLRLHELTNAKKARDAHIANVDPAILEAIHADRFERGMGQFTLARKYGLSEGVIRRILKDFSK
jgi:hypothetical protein